MTSTPSPLRLLPRDDPLWRLLDHRQVRRRLLLAWYFARKRHALTRYTHAPLDLFPVDMTRDGDHVTIEIAGEHCGTILVADLLGSDARP